MRNLNIFCKNLIGEFITQKRYLETDNLKAAKTIILIGIIVRILQLIVLFDLIFSSRSIVVFVIGYTLLLSVYLFIQLILLMGYDFNVNYKTAVSNKKLCLFILLTTFEILVVFKLLKILFKAIFIPLSKIGDKLIKF